MAKMKALQPEMVRLKDLHKDDKMKLQQEMMALYKKEKVNPMSGCLPILVQIPVFFALYKVLFVTIEMRQMPFYGWIQDLSERDPTSLFNLFGLLPYDVPSFLMIGAWPIAMGVSMFIQQKLNPAPTDPMQAKIFMFFPLFLNSNFSSIPCRIVIYWTVNNILTMAQQVFIMKRTTIKTTLNVGNQRRRVKKILPSDGPSIDEVKRYLEKYNDEYIVIKCGGSVLVDQNLFEIFIKDITH